jgi:cell wall-associated NlpC family hydrolase
MDKKKRFSTRRRAIQILVMLAICAGMLGADMSEATAHQAGSVHERRVHVVRRGKSQRGTRYRWGGASPKRGFDCSGLSMWVFDGHGAQLPHSSMMQYRLAGENGYRRIRNRSKLVKGDLVFFDTSRTAKVGHVGIYIGKGKMVSSRSAGVGIDSVYDKYYWGKRYVGALRIFHH